MKQCQECGRFCSDDTKFCSVCGIRFPDIVDVGTDNINPELQELGSVYDEQKQSKPAHPEIIPLLQRIVLFLEDGEFRRADDYCERVLDIEPTNAEAYIGKLLVEFGCNTRNQLKNCTSSIANSKNFAKVLRFGDEKQKSFVADAEKAIQANIARISKEATIRNAQKATTSEEQIVELDQQEAEIDAAEEYYIDIACPYCHEELSYTNWQIEEGELTCPMCDAQFVFDERMRI